MYKTATSVLVFVLLLIFMIVGLFFLPPCIYADIISLVNGQSAKCKIIDTTGNTIEIDRSGRMSRINKNLVVFYKFGDEPVADTNEMFAKDKTDSICRGKIKAYISQCIAKPGIIKVHRGANTCCCVYMDKTYTDILPDGFKTLKERLEKSLKLSFVSLQTCANLLALNADSLDYLLVLQKIVITKELGSYMSGGGFNSLTGAFSPGSSISVYIFRSSIHATIIDLKLKAIVFDMMVKTRSDEIPGNLETDDKRIGFFQKGKSNAFDQLFKQVGETIVAKIRYTRPESEPNPYKRR